MAETRGTIVSRLRSTLKEVNSDTPYSNRGLWHTFFTVSRMLVKEDADKGKIYSQSNPWESVCLEMEPVNSIYCDCVFLPYNCTVYRSKRKLPALSESSSGFIYRFISTPDMSQNFTLVSAPMFNIKSNIKYNKDRYAFIHDGYLYTPKHTFPTLIISGIFDEDTSDYDCRKYNDNEDSSTSCNSALNKTVNLNDYLIDRAIKMALAEIAPLSQKPTDELPNNNELQKEISL